MKNLATLRRAAGLTQYGLGRKARVGRSKISDVEIGRATFNDIEESRILLTLTKCIGANVAKLNEVSHRAALPGLASAAGEPRLKKESYDEAANIKIK